MNQEQVRRILGYLGTYYPGFSQDIAILDIEVLITNINNFCNIDEFPIELEKMVAQMLSKVYSDEYAGVSKIKEGDTDITFSSKTTTENVIDLMRPYLFKFRRLYV